MSVAEDELIHAMSYRPERLFDAFVPNNESPQSTTEPNRRQPQSSLGPLESVPLEVLQESLGYLDIVSLSHFHRTCLRGSEVVNSLPNLKRLIETASGALAVIARARLLSLHSVHTRLAPLR